MGKEDIGLIVNAMSIYRTIDSSYFLSPNNGYVLESLLELENFNNNSLYTAGQKFFNDIFTNFVCQPNNILDLDTIRRKLFFMENLIFSIKSILINNLRKDVFSIDDIKNFYSHSYALTTNYKYLISHIEYKEESFNNNEFSHLDIIQNNFKSYVVSSFWNKYFTCLSQNDLYQELHTIERIHTLITPTVEKVTTTNNSRLERYMIQIKVEYDKKKTTYFDYIDYNSLFFDDLRSEYLSKKMYLYFYKDIYSLKEIYNPNYTHNLLGYETSNNNDFFVNIVTKKYHVKYHLNDLKQAYNIFIYGYYKNNGKNILVGFAFKDEDHYQNSWRKFLYKTESASLDIHGKFREGYIVTGSITNSSIFESIDYQWEKSLSVLQKFESISEATTQSFNIPLDGNYKNKYLRLKATCLRKNGEKEILYSRPKLIDKNLNLPATGSVSLSGDFQDGGVVSVDTQSITDPDGTIQSYTYVWESKDSQDTIVNLNHMTDTYTIPDDHSLVDKQLRVTVTTQDSQGGQTSFVSDWSVPVVEPPVEIVEDDDPLVGMFYFQDNEYNRYLGAAHQTSSRQGSLSQTAGAWQELTVVKKSDGYYALQSYQGPVENRQYYYLGDAVNSIRFNTQDINQSTSLSILIHDNTRYSFQRSDGKYIGSNPLYYHPKYSGNYHVIHQQWVFTRLDRPATGSVSLSGDFQNGGVVSVDTQSITDPDGTIQSYTYLWESKDSQDTIVNLNHSTGTYTIPDDHSLVDKQLRVTVTTQDSQGGETSFVSDWSSSLIDPIVGTFYLYADGRYLGAAHQLNNRPASLSTVAGAWQQLSVVKKSPGVYTLMSYQGPEENRQYYYLKDNNNDNINFNTQDINESTSLSISIHDNTRYSFQRSDGKLITYDSISNLIFRTIYDNNNYYLFRQQWTFTVV